jgi:hypothetical protein
MESLLLGALAVAGFNTSKKVKKSKNREKFSPNELNSQYSSNIEDKMDKIEQAQASNLIQSIKEKKPEYFKQFDELTFDNISNPVAMTDSHITVSGIDPGLQKTLDLVNGYSNLNDDLNYRVVDKEHFTHNNMIPNTTKRDYAVNDSRASRKLEAFTGVNENYVPKKEKYPLFEPMKNLTYVNGMPVFTDYLDDRYLPSSKNNNGNLPFQNNVLIKPGIDGDNRKGLGTVYRILPRSTDALRGDFNPKMSFKNKPLETKKIGAGLRGPDFNLTKYKIPDFMEVNFEDLLPTKAVVPGQKKTGKYTNVASQRGEEETYYNGHANNGNMGDGPSVAKTAFEPSKRQELYNDPTHAVNAVNIRPVHTNIESFTNRDTQRASVNASRNGGSYYQGGASYTYDKNYIPLPTTREVTSHNMVLGAKGSQYNPNVEWSDKARKTIRETTSHNIVANAKPENSGPGAQFTDKAKKTIRESTNHNIVMNAKPENSGPGAQIFDKAKKTIRESTSHSIVANAKPENSGPGAQITDNAKKTIRESTSHNIVMNAKPENSGPGAQIIDKAKPTIKESTLYCTPSINVGASVIAGYTKDDKDKARKTIRQTTENNTYDGGFKGAETYEGYVRDEKDEARKTIKQTTENNTYDGGFKGAETYEGYVRDERDKAKPTHRQTTENTEYEGPLHGTDNFAGYVRDAEDKARATTKETTHLTDYVGGLSWGVDRPTSHVATDNMTIRDTREIATYNRTSGGGANLAGPQINKDTVKFNERKESVYYVPHPSRPLDNNLMPSGSESYNKKTFENKKPQLNYGDYYTNNIFINTLNENPYVNDIFHQKNYKFDNHSLDA